MKAKQAKEITIIISEQEARDIKDFLYWLDSTTIPDALNTSVMDLYNVLDETLDAKDPIPLYDIILIRKFKEKKI